jgi:hypothetical protein
MPEEASKSQVILARLAVILMVGLAVLGAFWYGLSAEVHERIWRDVFNRPGGPMTFRFVLQPVMAAIAALHDGIKDARRGRLPYLPKLLTHSGQQISSLKEGLIATARILLLGLGMDAVYQYTVLKAFYPGEMVIIAILLAFVPYLLFRGPIDRIVSRWRRRPV